MWSPADQGGPGEQGGPGGAVDPMDFLLGPLLQCGMSLGKELGLSWMT